MNNKKHTVSMLAISNVYLLIKNSLDKLQLLSPKKNKSSKLKTRGYLDKIMELHFHGWAADFTNPERKLTVEILESNAVVASGVASQFRGDLLSEGIGDGRCGFIIPIPEIFFDGSPHIFSARLVETGKVLDNKLVFQWSGSLAGETTALDEDATRSADSDSDSGEGHAIEGEITGLNAGRILGKLKGGYREGVDVEIVESGDVVATGTCNQFGRFSIQLPTRLFDGLLHHVVVNSKVPAVQLAEQTIRFPLVSTESLLHLYWEGGLNVQDIPDAEKNALISEPGATENLEILTGLILHAKLFDHVFYQQQLHRPMGIVEAVRHFLKEGAAQGLVANSYFIPIDYRCINLDVNGLDNLSELQLFVHYVVRGRSDKRYFSFSTLKRHAAEMRSHSGFDDQFYSLQANDAMGNMDPCEHYLAIGWRDGVMPNRRIFNLPLYVASYETLADSEIPPYLHYLRQLRKFNLTETDISHTTPSINAMIDNEYYQSQLQGTIPKGISNYMHHMYNSLANPLADLSPNPEFSAKYYLGKYHDIVNASVLPSLHWLKYGRNEGRSGSFDSDKYIVQGGVLFDPNKPTILVVCHEASRTGAPILGFRLLEYFSSMANVVSWNGRTGALTEEFRASSVAVINTFLDAVDSVFLVKAIKQRFALQFAVVNSVVTVGVAAALYEEKVPMVALIHEYADYMGKEVLHMLRYANRVVFPAEGVSESAEVVAIKAFGSMTTNVTVRHQGRCLLPKDEEGQAFTRDEIVLALGISDDDEMPAIVLGCGWMQMRKGVEYFIEAARQVKAQLNRPVRFVWVGGGYKPDTDLQYSTWLRSQIVNSDLQDDVVFFEETADLDPFFQLADAFFLPSRLDPFPNVAIDAVCAGVPVVVFEQGTGFAEFIHANPSVGVAVPYLDVEAASRVICEYVNGERPVPVRDQSVLDSFSFRDYAEFVWKQGMAAQDQQKMINKESQLIIQSKLMDRDFLLSAGFTWHPNLMPEYEYVALWARGIRLAKSRVGFNDKVAESTLAAHAEVITPLAGLIKLQASPATHNVLVVNSKECRLWQGKERVALHIHAHYTETLPKLLRRLGPLARKMSLYITTNTEEKAEAISSMVDANVEVVVVPNRGRDVGPFIMMLQEKMARYDIVGHFHIKGTKQLDLSFVKRWQDFLFDSLIGKNGEVANELLQAFEKQPELGLLFQEDPNLLGWNKNRDFAQSLLDDLEIKCPLPENIEYPTGNMFWARVAAFTPLMKGRKWEWQDFPAEPVPYDGSVLHAIERLTPAICQQAGFQWATVFNPVSRRS